MGICSCFLIRQLQATAVEPRAPTIRRENVVRLDEGALGAGAAAAGRDQSHHSGCGELPVNLHLLIVSAII